MAWSPDGRRLLIASVRPRPEYALWDLETNAISRLPISPYVPSAEAGGVTPSPNGRLIAFLALAEFGEARSRYLTDGLFVVSRDGGDARLLLQPFRGGGSDGFDW